MDIIAELKQTRSRDTAETKALYVGIARRSSIGESRPEDAAILGEIIGQLGFTEAQVERDIANLKTFFQAQKNLYAHPTPKAIGELITEAVEKRNLAATKLTEAQERLNAAWQQYNGACGLTNQCQMLEQMVQEARELVAHLIPD